jgi:S-formylglutathione hydrolase FrmB
VDVNPVDDAGRILRLAFDSAVLGRRTESLVWLPGAGGTGPLPVVYYLHGTVATTLPAPLRRTVDRAVARGHRVPFMLRTPTRPAVEPFTMRFDETQDLHRFLLVAPDAGMPPWCLACNWVDGVRGRGVAGEQFLYEELFPIVETKFGTRTDRGGRAVIGHSMGGGGALIQAFRHPDLFVFAGSSSGTMSILNDRTSRSGLRWLLYNRTQGFRPIPLDAPRYRNANLLDLATNVVGSGMEIVVVAGDGTPTGEQRPGPTTVTPDEDRRMELNIRRNNDLMVPRLRELGVPLTYIQRKGAHAIGASTFLLHLLDRINAVVGADVPVPVTFSYRAADPRIAVWGWEFDVERDRVEFLEVVDARTDGRAATLAGTGRVRVRTPATFDPGKAYTVELTRGGQRTVTATKDGRLGLELELGPPTTSLVVQ